MIGHRRRPAIAARWGAAAMVGLLVSSCVGTSEVSLTREPDDRSPSAGEDGGTNAVTADEPSAAAETTTTTELTPADDGKDATGRTLSLVETITGGLTPKSVEHTGDGRFFAQNMMYSHTMRVYDRDHALVATIDDSVDLSAFGHPGTFKGSPVEAAASADGSHMYVSNYQMYGPGFSNPGDDDCAKGSWDKSYVSRVDVATATIDQVIEVGPVPKYVATSPDGKWVLVTNWCGYDLSVIDAAAGKEVQRIAMGRFPRGIAVAPDSSAAYVTIMGGSDVAEVDLSTFAVKWIKGVGRGPRHAVLDPAGRFLYVTLNSESALAKIDLTTDRVVAKVKTAGNPRSMAISSDGTALYVVNYSADAMSKVATSDLRQLQRVPTNHHPIGITYDPGTRRVWVACYSGSLMVFQDA